MFAGRTAGSVTLQHKATKPLFFRYIGDENLSKLPVNITAGMYLEGNLTLIKDMSSVCT